MSSAINALVSQVFGALSAVSPFAKAVSVAVTALVSSLVNMAFAGSFDTTSIVVLGVGVLSAVVAYFTKNNTPVQTVPVPVPVAPVVKKAK
jgi:hypothetical protein